MEDANTSGTHQVVISRVDDGLNPGSIEESLRQAESSRIIEFRVIRKLVVEPSGGREDLKPSIEAVFLVLHYSSLPGRPVHSVRAARFPANARV